MHSGADRDRELAENLISSQWIEQIERWLEREGHRRSRRAKESLLSQARISEARGCRCQEGLEHKQQHVGKGFAQGTGGTLHAKAKPEMSVSVTVSL